MTYDPPPSPARGVTQVFQVEDQRTHRGVLDIVDFLRVVRDSPGHFAQFLQRQKMSY